jgi:type II secretory pathway pseudopilin PulG
MNTLNGTNGANGSEFHVPGSGFVFVFGASVQGSWVQRSEFQQPAQNIEPRTPNVEPEPCTRTGNPEPGTRKARVAGVASDGGFALVELMISGMVTAVALAVAMTAFQGMSQTGDGAALLSDVNLSLRSTLNLMTRDLLSAGRDIPVGGIPIPSGANAGAVKRPSPAGTTRVFEGDMLPAVSPGDALGPAIGGALTDLVTILVADPDFLKVPIDVAEDGASARVEDATPIDGPGGIAIGDLIMFEAAGHRALQMVTGHTDQTLTFTSGDEMNLNQRGASEGTIMPVIDEAVDPSNPELRMMEATRVLMISYYIDTTNPDKPILMRRVNLGPERAIGIGVENVQATYDLVDGVTNPLNVPSPEPERWNQIRKANVFLTGRSYREWGRTQQYLRTSVSTQMSLRSLSFRDRYNLGEEQ